MNATDTKKEIARYIDEIVRVKLIFVRRSRDYFRGISINIEKKLAKNIVLIDMYI